MSHAGTNKAQTHWAGCERVHEECREISERNLRTLERNAKKRAEISYRFMQGEIDLAEADRLRKQYGVG